VSDKHNVFISWSGERSKWAASSLRDWLPLVLQSARPWMSEEDIEKGSRGLDEVGRALEGMRIGIICLTPENLLAPWISFEAGALSKTLDARTRVCTYLLTGLRPQDIERPLGMFQATSANQEDTKRLVHAVNKALEGEPVPDANLDAVFDRMWPLLAEELSKMPVVSSAATAKRPVEEMVAEILEISRAAATSRSRTEHVERYLPILEELMPFIGETLKAARNAQAHAPSAVAVNPPPDRAYMAGIAALAGRPEPKKLFCVKIQYIDQITKIEGTSATEDFPGRLTIFDGAGRPVARFTDHVENWWTESLPDTGGGAPTL
jgi:hypothetical protein